MLTRLADLGIRAPRRVLVVAGFLLVLATVFGAPVASRLSSGGFSDPTSESSRAADVLAESFDAGSTNFVLTVSAPDGADSDAARTVGRDLATRLGDEDHVVQVSSLWTAPRAQAAALRSDDGSTGLVVARVTGDDSEAPKRAQAIAERLAKDRDGVTVRAGGIATTFAEVNDTVSSDLAASEAIAIPLTAIVLVLVFGSLYAALMPLALGIVSILGTLAVLRGIAALTDVSIFALNMTTALGLALAIDYSLLVVNRYREEVRGGADPATAVRTTMHTAGRTVLFSALTVALSLAAMLVFPLYFLRSFAYAGIAVVALATVSALVLLPAILTLVGGRIDKLDLRRAVRRMLRRPEPAPKPVEQTAWYRFARAVMKRALPVAVAVVAFLVFLGLPFLGVKFGYPDERVLPKDTTVHQVGDRLRDDFPANAAGTLSVVVPSGGTDARIAPYATELSRLDGVTSVAAVTGTYADGRAVAGGNPALGRDGATYLQVRSDLDPESDAASDLVTAVRAAPAPFDTLVTGQAAVDRDSLDALGDALPWALALIAVTTLIVLFLFTGSLLLPLKAVVLNLLSLSATFGAMVWIFQDGHLGWLFPDLTTTGALPASMPPLMFCLAFGLSMDYEVFLLSRIREEYLASGDNERAVAVGLGHTGRIVTAAATLMAIVFAAIATSGVSFMMLFGTGLTLAVLMDATVVRGMLVPAFMRLAGRWNWWAPRPLARLHERIGLHEGAPAPGPRKELVDA
ncbi:MMPL family transporter [Jatrophihabitans fulvus]